MQHSGTGYTLGFAALVCAVCSVLVSSTSVMLRPQQQQNILIDRQKNVLVVAGLVKPSQSVSSEQIQQLFTKNIKVRYINLHSGEYVPEEKVPQPYDPPAAAQDPVLGHSAPTNSARVLRLPQYAVVHQVENNGNIEQVILQVWGEGLWSTMYGYLSLDRDGVTIRGLTFYQQEETPGLGGEVDNPKWKALWVGRKAFDEQGNPAIRLIKGFAGPPDQNPHEVDALSGATLTSRGVEDLINFWLQQYEPYLNRFQKDSV